MYSHTQTIAAMFAALAITGASLSANTIMVSNINDVVSNRYDLGDGLACAFTVGTVDVDLESIYALLDINDEVLTASIHRDREGTVWTTLCSTTISGLTTGTDGIVNFSNFSGDTELYANTTYWLQIRAEDNSSSQSGWYTATIGSSSGYDWEIHDGIQYSSYGSFFSLSSLVAGQFSVYAVPEPATYAGLLGMGALGIALIRRRRS